MKLNKHTVLRTLGIIVPIIILSSVIVFLVSGSDYKAVIASLEKESELGALASNKDFYTLPEITSEKDPEGITLFLSGDILLTRLVGRSIRNMGYDGLFKNVRPMIAKADLAFTNLETPVSFKGSAYYGKPENVTFRAEPGVLFSVKDAGFDIVSLANNHMNDYDEAALNETCSFLDIMQIKYVGAGKNYAEAHKPSIIKIKGYTIAFLAYAEPIWSVTAATEKSAGVAHADKDIMISDIQKLQMTEKPDFICVSVHWGDEHQHYPNTYQKEIAEACTNAGASLVIGHHPHVIQGIERKGASLIFYSFGNFAFDMADDDTYASYVALVNLKKNTLPSAEIFPVRIDKKSYAPSIAKGEEGNKILTDTILYSTQFKSDFVSQEGFLVLK